MSLLKNDKKEKKTIDPKKLSMNRFELYYEKMCHWLIDADKRVGPATQMRVTKDLQDAFKEVFKKYEGVELVGFKQTQIEEEIKVTFDNWLHRVNLHHPETKKRIYCAWVEFDRDVMVIKYNGHLTDMISGKDNVIMANTSPSPRQFAEWVKGYTHKEMELMR